MSFLKNRTVVGVICILLSLLICFGLTPVSYTHLTLPTNSRV